MATRTKTQAKDTAKPAPKKRAPRKPAVKAEPETTQTDPSVVVPEMPAGPVVIAPRDVTVTNATATSDEDALHGHFCTVVAGPHEGRYGVLLSTSSVDRHGRPKDVIVRTRDAENEDLAVDYGDLRPASAGLR